MWMGTATIDQSLYTRLILYHLAMLQACLLACWSCIYCGPGEVAHPGVTVMG